MGSIDGESDLRASGLVERLLEREERDGVRGSDENRFKFVSVARNELGASEFCCRSSSDPPRPFFGGGTGNRDDPELEDEDDPPETEDADREMGGGLGSAADLPLGELRSSVASSLRLTQLLFRSSSIPVRRSESLRSRAGVSSSASSSRSGSITTTGLLTICDDVDCSSPTRPGGEVMIVEGGNAPSRLCTLLAGTSLTDVLQGQR